MVPWRPRTAIDRLRDRAGPGDRAGVERPGPGRHPGARTASRRRCLPRGRRV